MDAAVLAMLIKDVLVPEVLVAIRAHRNVTGQDPTIDQVLAALQVDANRVISVGEGYLARTAPGVGAGGK